MLTFQITLAGILYDVTHIDGQIIFKTNHSAYGFSEGFTIEWRGCGWYLVDMDDKVYTAHIIAAQKWLDKTYHIEYNDGVGTIFPNGSFGEKEKFDI